MKMCVFFVRCIPWTTSEKQKKSQHSDVLSNVQLQEEMTSAAYGPELLAAYSDFERKLQAAKGGKEERINVVQRSAHSSDEVSISALTISSNGKSCSSHGVMVFVPSGSLLD